MSDASEHELPSFPDLIERYGLTEGDCDKPVTDYHLGLISRSCCDEWKFLPPYIGLETIVAEDIDKSQKSEREKRKDFFLQWKSTIGSRATYKLLITALLKMKCGQDAEKVCKTLKQPAGAVSDTPPLPDTAGKLDHCYTIPNPTTCA